MLRGPRHFGIAAVKLHRAGRAGKTEWKTDLLYHRKNPRLRVVVTVSSNTLSAVSVVSMDEMLATS